MQAGWGRARLGVRRTLEAPTGGTPTQVTNPPKSEANVMNERSCLITVFRPGTRDGIRD